MILQSMFLSQSVAVEVDFVQHIRITRLVNCWLNQKMCTVASQVYRPSPISQKFPPSLNPDVIEYEPTNSNHSCRQGREECQLMFKKYGIMEITSTLFICGSTRIRQEFDVGVNERFKDY